MQPGQLCALFQSIDELYFEGLLSTGGWRIKTGCLHDCKRPFSKPEGHRFAYVFHRRLWGLTIPNAQTIVLDHCLLNEEPALRLVLLHEMAHAKLMSLDSARKRFNAHGRRFVKELRRLLDRGEECLRPEIAFYARRKPRKIQSP